MKKQDDIRRRVPPSFGNQQYVPIKKPPLILRPLIWLWQVIWGALEPIVRLGLRVSVIALLLWGVFLFEDTQFIRDEAKNLAGEGWELAKESFPFLRRDYDSLHCQKIRERSLHAKNLIEKHEGINFWNNLFSAGALVGALATHDNQKESRLAAAGSIFSSKASSKERELEKAKAMLKRYTTEDLQCFTQNDFDQLND